VNRPIGKLFGVIVVSLSGVGRKVPEVGLVLCPMPSRSIVPGAGCWRTIG
jgi:hypothetical protein